MESTIKVAIIGSGGIAKSHVKAYKKIPGVEIAGVADIVPGKAAQFIADMELEGARAFERHEDLLELDLDGVSVCTPNVAHHRASIDALTAGKHVLVEKPLAVTLEQGVEMVQASKRSGKMLTVGFQPRYDPNMIAIKDLVRSGRLGKVYYVETGGGRRRGMPGGTFIRKDLAGAGAIADIGCYSLDMALNALGYPKPLTVSAVTSNYFGTNPKYHKEASGFEVEDFGVALIRLEGDITLHFKISWAMHMDTLGDTLFLGTDAGLKVSTPYNGSPYNGVWDGGVGSITLFHDEEEKGVQQTIPIIEHSMDRFYEKVYDFVKAVRENSPAPIPAEQILINQAIIDGILRSSETRREVEINSVFN